MAAKRAEAAILETCPKAIDSDVVEYLVGTVCALLEDEQDADAESTRSEFEATVTPLFEDHGVPEDETKEFIDRVVRAAFGSADDASTKFAPPKRGKQAEKALEEDAADLLCCVTDLLLMYGGSPEPLLRNTSLRLVRGQRYGVIGSNGSGKTTLMARIAKKDIAGFPQDMNVVHLRHEAILKGINPSTPAREYAKLRNTGDVAASEEELARSLKEVGFDSEDLLGKAVGALSGGWQMRLALACAVAQKANLLLLDEPTNHLDADAVRWLVSFVNRTCVGGEVGGTAVIVSHDPDFLNQVCTDIIHFTADAKLVYHSGNFDDFKAKELKGDEVKAQQLLEVGEKKSDEDGPVDITRINLGGTADKLVFPKPEKITGVDPNRPEPVVLTLKGVSFRYEGAETPVLNDLSLDIHLGSRIGVVGKNGSGKSTLLSIIGGRLKPNVAGELWMHDSLRLVYIAQHQESQLADYMKCTPCEYLQLRFQRGYDSEMPERPPPPVPPKELRRVKELARRHGKRGKEVESLVSRHYDPCTKECLYEVKWKDLGPADNTFEKTTRLNYLGVGHMIAHFDDMLSAAWGTEPQRPLTVKELTRHLEDFGLPEDASCHRQISMLSSGQKVKMMLAASFWTKPHIVCLDEPTNYLDTDTVEALQKALCNFKGGFVVVSHNERFVDAVCEQIWEVADGKVTTRTTLQKNSASQSPQETATASKHPSAAKPAAKKKNAGR